MDIATRVFFTIKAFEGPGWLNKIKEANINCTKSDYGVNVWGLQSCMKLKTTTELLQEIQDFCKNLQCNDNVYGGLAYKMVITRSVIVYINTTCDYFYDRESCSFIVNKSNRLLYPSDIRDICKTENICVWDPTHGSCGNKYGNRSSDDNRYVIKRPGQMNPYVPLLLDKVTDSHAFVTPIEKSRFVVNKDFQEIYPKLTWEYPKKLLDMLGKKTERIKQINLQDSSR